MIYFRGEIITENILIPSQLELFASFAKKAENGNVNSNHKTTKMQAYQFWKEGNL